MISYKKFAIIIVVLLSGCQTVDTYKVGNETYTDKDKALQSQKLKMEELLSKIDSLPAHKYSDITIFYSNLNAHNKFQGKK